MSVGSWYATGVDGFLFLPNTYRVLRTPFQIRDGRYNRMMKSCYHTLVADPIMQRLGFGLSDGVKYKGVIRRCW